MLGRDVLVLELARLVEGAVEHTREGGPDLRLLRAALDGRLAAQGCLCLGAELGRVRDELLRQLLVEEREDEMLGVDLRVAHPARELLRRADGFLRFEREPVEVHYARLLSGSVGSCQSTSSRLYCRSTSRICSRSSRSIRSIRRCTFWS